MNRLSFLALGVLLFSPVCFGQSTNSDSQTLQALLLEVRQLRQDMHSTLVATQRAQILIYRLQAQEAAVARTSQRLTETREKLTQLREEQTMLAENAKQREAVIRNEQSSEAERRSAELSLSMIKSRLNTIEGEEEQTQAREMEAQQQERDEELRFTDMREQLDRLDKTLENASRQAGANRR